MKHSIKQELNIHVPVNIATISKPTTTHMRFQVTKSQANAILKKQNQNQFINLQSLMSCTLREWKRSEKKVTEENCWAITQTAGRSCCGRSHSCGLRFVFQLGYLLQHTRFTVCMCIFSSDLQLIFRDVITASIRGVSVNDTSELTAKSHLRLH